MRSNRGEFLATCATGLEPALLAEARALNLARTEGRPGGVSFTGTIRDAWRANLWLRTASRVLLQVARFEAPDAGLLYAGVRSVDWERYLGPDGTFHVNGRTKASVLDHGLYIEQKVKDAVVDGFRERHGRRPSVDRADPDLRIQARLHRDRATILVDTSGESLFKRGWRRTTGEAPIKETVAAGMVLASGWDRRSPLLDPFCGSGTILIEAAHLAGSVAPGLFRESFGFTRWPGHDDAGWRAALEEARARIEHPKKLILKGWDLDPAAVEGALRNAAAAGLEGRIEFAVADARNLAPRKGWNAWIVTNPPYGARLSSVKELTPLYRGFGEMLEKRCGGFKAAILCGSPELARALGLAPVKTQKMKNGPIDCELGLFDVGR